MHPSGSGSSAHAQAWRIHGETPGPSPGGSRCFLRHLLHRRRPGAGGRFRARRDLRQGVQHADRRGNGGGAGHQGARADDRERVVHRHQPAGRRLHAGDHQGRLRPRGEGQHRRGRGPAGGHGHRDGRRVRGPGRVRGAGHGPRRRGHAAAGDRAAHRHGAGGVPAAARPAAATGEPAAPRFRRRGDDPALRRFRRRGGAPPGAGRHAAGRQVRGHPRPAGPLREHAPRRRAPADGRPEQARGEARPVPGGGDPERGRQQDVHAGPAGRVLGRRGQHRAEGDPGRGLPADQVADRLQLAGQGRAVPHLPRRRTRLLGRQLDAQERPERRALAQQPDLHAVRRGPHHLEVVRGRRRLVGDRRRRPRRRVRQLLLRPGRVRLQRWPAQLPGAGGRGHGAATRAVRHPGRLLHPDVRRHAGDAVHPVGRHGHRGPGVRRHQAQRQVPVHAAFRRPVGAAAEHARQGVLLPGLQPK